MSGLLRAMHLACPTLPIGAYAYSQGLEQAVELRWIVDEASTSAWIGGLLAHSVAVLDLPILERIHRALLAADHGTVRRYTDVLLASRETAELRAEERMLGDALGRVLRELSGAEAEPWLGTADRTYVGAFALGAVLWDLPASQAIEAYAFAWAEHQVSAATRLVPLGQRAAQRVLLGLIARIPEVTSRAARLDDDEIGAGAPAQAIASALHETQYSRLFRS